MEISQEAIAKLQGNAAAFFAAIQSRTPIIGPGVSLREGETAWTRWCLYADPAMTQSIGVITLKWNNSK
jgi:hypothetical protein